MSKPATIRFKATLLRPADAPRGADWSFFVLPKTASARLPTRGITTIEGTINGQAFRANAEPDGNKGHWLKVPRALRVAAQAEAGDTVEVEMTPATEQLEITPPADLRKALAAAPAAQAVWSEITPAARRDWVQWITSAKKPETRVRRIAAACDMLGSGKRRVCCFDRSGFYSKEFSAPKALA